MGKNMTSEQTNTAEKAVSISKEVIIKEAKRIYENCLYASKSHFIAADFWTNFHLWIGIPTVILAGIAGTLAFANFNCHDIIAGVISIIIIVFTSITTFLNPKERANIHLKSGNNYDSLLSNVRIFWTIECWREGPEELLADKLKDFADHRNGLNRDCPQPPSWAYRKAKKAIEEGGTEYFADRES